jgi:hypothetical protein
MDEEKKEIKVSKSYSLPPSQIEWLRKQALLHSTPRKTMSASAVLERIIDEAIQQTEQSPSEKKSRVASTREIELVA